MSHYKQHSTLLIEAVRIKNRSISAPGIADQLLAMAVSVLVVSMLLNTIYVYRNASGHSNLMTFLHEKYTPGIERFFLILLVPILIYNCVMILQGAQPANFILLVVMFGAGLQLIAMSWRTNGKGSFEAQSS